MAIAPWEFIRYVMGTVRLNQCQQLWDNVATGSTETRGNGNRFNLPVKHKNNFLCFEQEICVVGREKLQQPEKTEQTKKKGCLSRLFRYFRLFRTLSSFIYSVFQLDVQAE